VHASVLVLAALAAAAPGPRLSPPVPGEVARAFAYAGDPFARGHHRGVDLAAAPGEPVRAACSGRVTFAAGAGANGRAVTIRCGAWSVTHLPLRHIAVRAGDTVVAGAPLGAAGASARHTAGLHLGVRRASESLGYVDPAPLLGTERQPPPPAAGPPPRTVPRRPVPPPPHPAPLPSRSEPAARPTGSRPAPAPAPRPGSSPAARPAPPGLAPWPVWAGLALLLSGAIGAGTVRAARRRRAPLPRAVAREVR